MSILSKVISPYVRYTNEFGFPGVRVRWWHPDCFIPFMKIKAQYKLGFYTRYKNQQETLYKINVILSEDWKMKDKLGEIEAIIQMIDCGFECEYIKPYGFTPEADCPIHDI